MWKKQVNVMLALLLLFASLGTLFGGGAQANYTTTVTIYYKKGMTNPFIHYRAVGSTSWTAAPGVPMMSAEIADYYKFSLNVGNASGLEVCFNNGKGVWDSNGGKNYIFKKGVSTYVPGTNGAPGKITAGAPYTDNNPPMSPPALTVLGKTSTSVTLRWLQAIDNVAIDSYEILRNNVSVGFTPNTAYEDAGLKAGTEYTYTVRTVDASGNKSGPTVPVTVTTNPAINNIATVYYKAPAGWAQGYVHFRPQGGNWTTAPGMKMAVAEVAGYLKASLNVGESTQVEAVFNNGGALWDNNGMKNYMLPIGASTVNQGVIKPGAPAPADSVAPSAPSNLALITKSDNAISLNWTAATDNVGVTGYQVFANGTRVATVVGTTATVEGMQAATAYTMTVKAVDAAGNLSPNSNELQVTTNAAVNNQVTLYYKPLVIWGQNVYVHYRPNGGNWTTAPGLKMAAADVAGHVSVTLSIGKATGIEAVFNNGGTQWDNNATKNYLFPMGIWTLDKGLVTPGKPVPGDTVAPSAPTLLKLDAKTDSSVQISWTAATDNVAVTGYEVYRGEARVATVTAPSATIEGLQSATNYTFTVKAVDAAGNVSASSNELPVTTNIGINNQLTIYYKPALAWGQNVFIHYRPTGGNWTTAPGVKMASSDVAGYMSATLTVGKATSVEAVFNNGTTAWDNNGTLNYKFSLGTSTLENGTIRNGKPTPINNDSSVTIFYRQGFAKPYIHYKIGGGNWTTSPGVMMTPSTYAGYSEITLPLVNNAKVEASFNDGATKWDSNLGHNYFFGKGEFTLDQGVIKQGKPDAAEAPINGTLMQYFEWDLVADGKHWNRMKDDAQHLNDIGVTALWLPPMYKGAGGAFDVGYGVYDRWDLGEFNQAGSVRTKYGTKDELKTAIAAVQAKGIQVYGDIVMNHNIGLPGGLETVRAVEIDPNNRNNATTDWYDIRTYTKFDYAERNGKYSTFKWNASHFKGAEINVNNGKKAIYRWRPWDADADTSEKGNYDFLLGTDIDVKNPDVASELKNWGVWLTNELNLNGYRIDAVKHISASFIKDWVDTMRAKTGKNLFAFGEYASGNPAVLEGYMNKVGWNQSMYDFKLKGNLSDIIKANGFFDMRNMLYQSFADKHPMHTVTYVNIHDTQPGQFDDSYIPWWHQQRSYAVTLTRQEGYPLVFYGDYYGIPKVGVPAMKDKIDPLLKARQYYAYGKQNNYFDHQDVVGWTREGDNEHFNSGLATLISDGLAGSKWMYVGKQHAGEIWHDLTGNRADQVVINADGWGYFSVNAGSSAVYVHLRTP